MMKRLKRSLARKFWRKRGLGAKKNPVDRRDRLFMANHRVDLPSKVSLEEYSTIKDQGMTGSCAGNAVAGAVWILEQKSGNYTRYPSRMFLYWNSRICHDQEPLSDEGTYIRTCCKALNEYGVTDEDNWPFVEKRVNTKPAFHTYMSGNARKNGEYLSITGEGDDLIFKIKNALHDGYPVVFGTLVADSFLDAAGDDVIDRPRSFENIAGGHAMCIVGYDTVAGKTIFRVMNSWGQNWRDDGYCWFTENYMTWENTWDFTIVKGWDLLK